MAAILAQIFADYGLLALWGVVLADQAGLPLPAVPALLYAGVMLRAGQIAFWPTFIGACAASCAGHTLWFAAGRRRGPAIVRLMCRMSLSPDACVRRTQQAFSYVGPWALLGLRFVPGFDVMAQPLVAINGMPWRQYLAITVLGAVLWVGAYLGLGFAAGTAKIFAHLRALGSEALPPCVGLFAIYLITRASWQLFHDTSDVPRVLPEGLAGMMHADTPLMIVDLRRRYELRRSGRQIPGACRFSRLQLRNLARNPRPGVTAIMLCECPREAGSAFMASVFRRNGWQQTFALVGGLTRWQAEGRPTQGLKASAHNVDV